MVGFPESHDRLVALEWLVQRLAVEHCLATSNPIGEANRIVADSQAYTDAMVKMATRDQKGGLSDQLQTAFEIAVSMRMLVEHLPADVTDAIG